MKTLEITNGITAHAIADDIITLIKSENGLLVCAIGANAISQAISGIELVKRILKLDGLFLNISSSSHQQNTQGDLTQKSMTLEIISSPVVIEMDLVPASIEAAI